MFKGGDVINSNHFGAVNIFLIIFFYQLLYRLKSAHLGNDYEGKLGEDQHSCDAEPIERSVSAKDCDKYELCEKDDCKRWVLKKAVDGSPLRSRHCSEKQNSPREKEDSQDGDKCISKWKLESTTPYYGII